MFLFGTHIPQTHTHNVVALAVDVEQIPSATRTLHSHTHTRIDLGTKNSEVWYCYFVRVYIVFLCKNVQRNKTELQLCDCDTIFHAVWLAADQQVETWNATKSAEIPNCKSHSFMPTFS